GAGLANATVRLLHRMAGRNHGRILTQRSFDRLLKSQMDRGVTPTTDLTPVTFRRHPEMRYCLTAEGGENQSFRLRCCPPIRLTRAIFGWSGQSHRWPRPDREVDVVAPPPSRNRSTSLTLFTRRVRRRRSSRNGI